ncbi:MAG: hypothetical protein ACRCSQ_10445 [Bacteroidales bacterium]
MPTHGTKRIFEGEDQVFHHSYGWISAREFYDLVSGRDDHTEDSPDLEPDYVSRQSGESHEHYKHRIQEMQDYSDGD